MVAKRILVVEDDGAIMELERRILVDAGYEVDCATSGDDALELISRNAYILVIADVMMPGMDGFDLTKEIKRIYPKGLPVLLVTALGDALKEAHKRDARPTSTLQKPFTKETLLTAVRMLEGQSEQSRAKQSAVTQRNKPHPKEEKKKGWLKKLLGKDE